MKIESFSKTERYSPKVSSSCTRKCYKLLICVVVPPCRLLAEADLAGVLTVYDCSFEMLIACRCASLCCAFQLIAKHTQPPQVGPSEPLNTPISISFRHYTYCDYGIWNYKLIENNLLIQNVHLPSSYPYLYISIPPSHSLDNSCSINCYLAQH